MTAALNTAQETARKRLEYAAQLVVQLETKVDELQDDNKLLREQLDTKSTEVHTLRHSGVTTTMGDGHVKVRVPFVARELVLSASAATFGKGAEENCGPGKHH